MLRIYRLSSIILAFLFLSSCVTTQPFTQQIREKYKLTQEELSSLQFYTSSEIILTKSSSSKTKNTNEGTLTLKDKNEVTEVVIPANTPCTVESVVDGKRVTVDFGEGKTLIFGGMKKYRGYYALMALEWRNGRGKVKYGEEEYLTQPGAGSAYLTLEIKGLKESKKERSVVGGSTVN